MNAGMRAYQRGQLKQRRPQMRRQMLQRRRWADVLGVEPERDGMWAMANMAATASVAGKRERRSIGAGGVFESLSGRLVSFLMSSRESMGYDQMQMQMLLCERDSHIRTHESVTTCQLIGRMAFPNATVLLQQE